MRVSHALGCALLASLVLIACGSNSGDGDGGADDGDGGPCQGLECFQVDCPNVGETTSVSGIVYAPNGTLPLYNVTVYVPNGTPGAFPAGAQCDRCGTVLSGNPLVETVTDTFVNTYATRLTTDSTQRVRESKRLSRNSGIVKTPDR